MVKQFVQRNMKYILSFTLAASLVLVFVLAGMPPQTAAAGNTPAGETKRTLSAAGQGTVKASPDIAYVTLGVITENTNAKTTQQSNAAAMDKITAAVKAAGIKSEDIKTVNYSIYPKYDYQKDTGESKITGYTVNNSIQVTVRDITKAGNIIDLAAQNGANTSSQISFGLSNYEKYYNEALKLAVETAKNRAATMADALGLKLGSPASVTENGGYAPPPIHYGFNGGIAKAEDSVATPISAGSLEIQASVGLTYEY
jgi:uncharacterized protein